MPDTVAQMFDPAVLSPYFRLRRTNISTPMTGFVQLALANVNRVLLCVASVAQQLIIMPGLPLANDAGISIPPNTVPFIAKFADWGGIVGFPWYVLSTGAGPVVVTVTEVIYYPEN